MRPSDLIDFVDSEDPQIMRARNRTILYRINAKIETDGNNIYYKRIPNYFVFLVEPSTQCFRGI
jgi:hypothetical protein